MSRVFLNSVQQTSTKMSLIFTDLQSIKSHLADIASINLRLLQVIYPVSVCKEDETTPTNRRMIPEDLFRNTKREAFLHLIFSLTLDEGRLLCEELFIVFSHL